MAQLDTTSFDYALKHKYSDAKVKKELYEDAPLLALMPKSTTFGGKNYTFAVVYAPSAGRSAVFATAQTNASNHTGNEFVVTRVKDYAVFKIDNETIEASKNDSDALLEAASTEIDMARYALKRSVVQAVAGSGSGRIGKIAAAGISSATVTLEDPDDIVNFEVGMVLQMDTADGTGTVHAGTVTVESVDRSAGTFTCTDDVTTGIADAAAADFIFAAGDYGVKMKGVEAWIPTSTPSATTFFGVDRSVDPTRLAGFRFDGSALNPDEAILKGLLKGGREGVKATHVFTNYTHWSDLQLALGSKVIYEDVTGEAGVGFRSIVIQGPRGQVKVLADNSIPTGVAKGLYMPSWQLKTLGECPRWLDTGDGLKMLRQASADGIEGRLGLYGNVLCREPGANIHIDMPE